MQVRVTLTLDVTLFEANLVMGLIDVLRHYDDGSMNDISSFSEDAFFCLLDAVGDIQPHMEEFRRFVSGTRPAE